MSVVNVTQPRDKRKYCLNCKYHSWLQGVPQCDPSEISDAVIKDNLQCYYSEYAHRTCLRYVNSKDTYDIRGDGPGCELFKEGKSKDDNILTERWVRGAS